MAPDRSPISVSFDNESGVYELKTGRQLTVTPIVANAVNPRYKWVDDRGTTVASGLTLSFSSQTEGVFYFTFCVDADNGSAREEIRIDVLSMVIPTVTLPSEMQTTVGRELTITPAVSTGGDESAAYEWQLDDTAVSSDTVFTFHADKEGSYTLRLTVSNSDGSGSAEMKINVTSGQDLSVSFPRSEIEVLSGRTVSLAPIIRDTIGPTSYEWSIDGRLIADANAMATAESSDTRRLRGVCLPEGGK